MTKATNPLLILFLAVVISVGAVWMFSSYIFVPQTPFTTTTTTIPLTDAGCRNNPSVVLSTVDALQPGTSVSAGAVYRLNGQYIGSTSPTVRGTADLIVSANGYLNRTYTGIPINCGSNQINAALYNDGNATVSIYSNAGTAVLTNHPEGGTYNETKAAAGGQYNWKVHMVGTDKKATGTQLFIVDMKNTSAVVDSISLTSMTGSPAPTSIAVPKGYGTKTSGGYSAAFLVPSLEGANTYDYNLQVQATTGSAIAGPVYISIYNLHPFVETDGTFNPGTTAWDSIGTNKTASYQTYDFCINSDTTGNCA